MPTRTQDHLRKEGEEVNAQHDRNYEATKVEIIGRGFEEVVCEPAIGGPPTPGPCLNGILNESHPPGE